eukprot:TRINITY_DN27651_c0_g1_i1.p2 TRINITY_DN27651_c0_g1~~TRINITY_DN27651_c0_g1_i1.p2  ORF type:complete len:131 (+),score=28.19 TRINITY_DN27651_c0_g1_i1:503-895(+)
MLTFQATAFSLTNKKIVLDECVYTQLVGRWKDLFNKLKGNVINSAIKSVVGLQNRKFDKLLRESDLESLSANPGASQQKGNWGLFSRKKKVEAEALLMGDDVIQEDEQDEGDSQKEKKKRQQLLGTLGRK